MIVNIGANPVILYLTDGLYLPVVEVTSTTDASCLQRFVGLQLSRCCGAGTCIGRRGDVDADSCGVGNGLLPARSST